MKEIMIHLKAMQIFSHFAHILVSRTPFHSDHMFFSETYKDLITDFDMVAERIVGIFGEEPINISNILASVSQTLALAPCTGVKENTVYYSFLLTMEQELCKMIGMACKISSLSEGTKQLLGDICNKSEIRQYKIKQRIKK